MGIETASKDDELVVLKIVYWQKVLSKSEKKHDKYVTIFEQPTARLLNDYFKKQVIKNMFTIFINEL